MILSEIWIYPVKSLGGIRLKKSRVEQRGLEFDRRWLVVDESGTFLTQRTHPKMSLIGLAPGEAGFKMFNKRDENDFVLLPYLPETSQMLRVKIWKDVVEALTVCPIADAWLSRKLDKNVRIVYMPDSTQRLMDPRDSPEPTAVSFADDFPYLLISQASLDDLNSRLTEPVSMERFRPNFVISQTLPYAEDSWHTITIGVVRFLITKPCERCIVINIDQQAAQKGTEPLKTLASYRRADKKIHFGQNVISSHTGTIYEGDAVQIVT